MEDGGIGLSVEEGWAGECAELRLRPADGDGDGSLAPGQTPRQDRYTTAQI